MKKNWILGLIFLGLGIGLTELTRMSLTPEKNTNLWNAAPAFLVFLLFAYALLALGAWIRSLVKLPFFSGAENGLFDLSVGTVLLYELAYVLTPLHLFSASMRILLWVILSVAVVQGSRSIQIHTWFSFAKTKGAKFLLAVPLLILFLKLVEGVEFHVHGDAYVAYLPGPRSWGATGTFENFFKFPQLFITTTWESLYAWGTALMGLTGGAGLDITQFFAQWCTGGIAVMGISLGAIALGFRLAKIFPLNASWFPVLAVSAVQVPVLQWTSNLAKNDTGIAFLGFAGFYLATYLSSYSALLALLAGMVTGAAVMGKLTIGILGVCIGLGVLLRTPKRILPFGVGGFLGIGPVIIRNWVLTRNPVFPWYDKVFHSGLLSKTVLNGVTNATTQTQLGWERVLFYLQELHHELPIWPVLLILIFVLKDRKKALQDSWIPLTAIILFTCTFRTSTEIRYQNASLVIMAAFFCFYGFYLLSLLPEKFSKIASWCFAIAIIGTANITTFTLFQIGGPKFAPLQKKLTPLAGGEGKLWIRENLKPTDKILVVGDPHDYYILDYDIVELGQSIEWDGKMGSEDVKTFEHSLQTAPFDYLYLANDLIFFNFLAEANQIMNDSAAWNQTCKRYGSPNVQIWDVNCLKKI